MFQVWHVQMSKYWCLWCRQSAHTAQSWQMDAWGQASQHMQHGPLACRRHELLHGAANLTRSNRGWLSRMPGAFDQHATLHTCLCVVKQVDLCGCLYVFVCACVHVPMHQNEEELEPILCLWHKENCPHSFNSILLERKIRSSSVVLEKILSGSWISFLLESLRPRRHAGADTMKLGFIWNFCFLQNTLWMEMEI